MSIEANNAGCRPHVWDRGDGGLSNDLPALREQLEALAGGWQVSLLGTPLGEPLPLWHRPAVQPGAARLLIACGFHGEEPAGPWGLLAFLRQTARAELDRVQLSLLPLVNATGLAAGTRFNRRGENPNRGFMPWLHPDTPSAEGQVLISHAEQLGALGAGGVLSCHEDVGVAGAYVYTYERTDAPAAFSHRLRDALAEHLELHPDGDVDGCPIAEGIVHNQIDGSFEAWLFDRGASVAACVETPGLQPFERRVAAQAAAIRAFING